MSGSSQSKSCGAPAGYVAIIGKPNAGKSTLLNGILGQKLSIVTSKAQTTRHRIIGLHSEEKFQIIFLDTPGVLREASTAVRWQKSPCTLDCVFCHANERQRCLKVGALCAYRSP